MGSPDDVESTEKFQELSKEYSNLKPLVQLYQEYKSKREELEDNREMLEDATDEMEELVREDIAKLSDELSELTSQIKSELVPEDPDRNRNVILEIRAGTGGDEAAIFAGDLFRMYKRFASGRGWKAEIIDQNQADHGGFKQVTAMLKGKGAFGDLQFESGVHRVQRVPETESGGRIHTSAASVAVLPEARDIDIDINESDLRVDTFRASGAGGQHVNMTDSAVRITHQPTDTTVECQDERSQHKNRDKAMKILRSRLYDKKRKQQQEERRQERLSQIGSGDRSEKIRTYNFPQSRVTDHRIDLDLYNLEEILDGELGEIIEALKEADHLEKLKNLEDEGYSAEVAG